MGKFDPYKIDLKGLAPGIHQFDYLLDNKFFTDIDGTEIQKGKVKIHLTLNKTTVMFDLNFELEGVAVIPCDRCLDDMDLPVTSKNRLIVKFGKDYSEESDEIVIIPEDEGVINLAWFMYEFAALTIPLKHIHAPGKCNKAMSSKLKKHSVKNSDDDDFDMDSGDDIVITDDNQEEDHTDPRWNALKGLFENDNN